MTTPHIKSFLQYSVLELLILELMEDSFALEEAYDRQHDYPRHFSRHTEELQSAHECGLITTEIPPYKYTQAGIEEINSKIDVCIVNIINGEFDVIYYLNMWAMCNRFSVLGYITPIISLRLDSASNGLGIDHKYGFSKVLLREFREDGEVVLLKLWGSDVVEAVFRNNKCIHCSCHYNQHKVSAMGLLPSVIGSPAAGYMPSISCGDDCGKRTQLAYGDDMGLEINNLFFIGCRPSQNKIKNATMDMVVEKGKNLHFDVAGSRSDRDMLRQKDNVMNQNNRKKLAQYKIYDQAGRCMWCNQAFTERDYSDPELIQRDHIQPKSQGGTDAYENIQLLHRHCHVEKTHRDEE